MAISFLAVSLVCLSAAAQQPGPEPVPPTTSAVLGSPLIAWTQFQKPQPVPQPRPDPVPLPEREPEQQQPSQPEKPPSSDSQPQTSTLTLEGMIVKDNHGFVLKATDKTVYQLDDQEKAKSFEDKKVKVTGTVDSGGKVIHVQNIELAT